ncbi:MULTISPECIES: acetyl-CoA carboxylase biotin carboxyl carrier protein [Protofrankia]|uniref:Biotin carboxyl carrier protein of acetyl-CoA carboxylase n=1 Tax=Candidatus Protofrankia datiscae TaxID=2716812 RepID=F8B4Y2_9ACTN|nr:MULTISPECIES: biotin/lipoyl-containing protein [Protofrankia]AEH10110.1 biotin/lipoyl attachment domain-containing protein [Candidatus Protofrankia datiscae]
MRPANISDQRQHVLSRLHEHATRLAGELPGQLGRIRVCSGDVAIEVEWSRATPGAQQAALPENVGALIPAPSTGDTAVERTVATRAATGAPAAGNGAIVSGAPANGAAVPGATANGAAANEAGENIADADVAVVTAPIVGTFYHAPEPGAEPFVTVGNVIDAGATIGIIEAMKLLNPVTADIGGTVARICVGNGETVEFDQVLVEIAP